MSLTDFLTVSDEIQCAIAPVALETTAIAHGLPFPQNLDVARSMETAVREHGGVPAWCGVLDGRLRVGLTPVEVERFARDPSLAKVSRRDLAPLVAAGGSGATTVAGTMALAHAAEIAVFATGGLGGVHRNAAESFDISADLAELARTPVTVICSGAKSILDIPKTLEMLETLGVPVLGLGCDHFPAFQVPSSGLPVDRRCETPAEVATIARVQRQLGAGGLVVGVPVPPDEALAAQEVEIWVREALADAHQEGIEGKAITPFLLNRLAALSSGRTLLSNIALLVNNAARATEIAVALASTQRP